MKINPENNINHVVAILLCATVFVECMIFHWEIYGSILVSSLWKDPSYFWSFYFPKISASIFVAGFSYLFKNKIWTIVELVVLDFWILANVIYFRSNQLLIDVFAFSMASNMEGFWDSILLYLDFKSFVPFLITLFYSIFVFLLHCYKSPRRTIKYSIFCFLFAYLCSFCGIECLRFWYERDLNMGANNLKHYYTSLSPDIRGRLLTKDPVRCVRQFSIIHLVGYDIIDKFQMSMGKYSMEKTDIEKAMAFFNIPSSSGTNPNRGGGYMSNPLIIVVFESLENWAVNSEIMPNLIDYMQGHNYLYAESVIPQVRGGNSMDGQMIINTGVLPIKQGATCFLFPANVYPSLADCFSSPKATIVPHGIHVWNQSMMSLAFGYDETIQVDPTETALYEKAIECINCGYQVVQCITIASHSPFKLGVDDSPLSLDSDMPHLMSDYIKAVNYSDSCLKCLLEEFKTNPILLNATLLITGDHNIFYEGLREKNDKYCKEHNIDYNVQSHMCPLIIFNPNITSQIKIKEECYQMDIFPTVMSLLGINNYYWKGLGTNLFQFGTCSRSISASEASELSDKMIRSNYFDQVLSAF